MATPPPINQALLTLLDNQAARTHAALEDLSEELFKTAPGGDCNSICAIGRHLIGLRRFQLAILGSPLAEDVAEPDSIESPAMLLAALAEAERLLREAILTHDPADWYAAPATPRAGKWGEEPTLPRFVRPFNDFVNHLGAIRAVRRMLGYPAPRTQ